jgi:DNA-binding transcriptional MerR regulator
LGFTLKEISDLLRLRVSRHVHCGGVKRRAGLKLKDVEQKIEHLKSIQKILKELIKACHSKARTEDCPILKSLEGNAK